MSNPSTLLREHNCVPLAGIAAAGRPTTIIVSGYLTEDLSVEKGPRPIDPDVLGLRGFARKWEEQTQLLARELEGSVWYYQWASSPVLEAMNRLRRVLLALGKGPKVAAAAALAEAIMFAHDHWGEAVAAAEGTARTLGKLCADLSGPVAIVGHSLGGRIAIRARETCPEPDRAPSAVTLAAAIGDAEVNWQRLGSLETGGLEILFSQHDWVLSIFFNGTRAWRDPAVGWVPRLERASVARLIDASARRDGSMRKHEDYLADVRELLRAHSRLVPFAVS